MCALRVRFSCSLKPQSGKQNFAIRLAREMKRKHIKIVKQNANVNLVFVKGIQNNCINILRLDNAWINCKMNAVGKNKKIRSIMKKCDAVIYQGKYSQRVCQKFIGKKRQYAIIPNGCDPSEFRNPYIHEKPYVLACSRWRPHKRLRAIALGFLESKLNTEFDLLVAGETDPVVKDQSIKYLGKIPNSSVIRLIAGCRFVSHLAFMDCCPNSVVESLVCGKPVLYANSGGMKELVGSFGFCVRDGKYDFTLIDLYSPPILDMAEVVRGYQSLVSMEHRQCTDLFIGCIADQYIRFIRRILTSRKSQ